MLNTSPASPIEKTGSRMSLDDINIPPYPLPLDGNCGTARVMPLALDSSPSGRPPQKKMPDLPPQAMPPQNAASSKTQITLIPVNKTTSPFKTQPTKENSQVNTSPISPIDKMGNRGSLDAYNTPTLSRQQDDNCDVTHCPIPPTKNNVPTSMPPPAPTPNATASLHTPPLVLNDAATTQRLIIPNTTATTPTAKAPHEAPVATPTLPIPPHPSPPQIMSRLPKEDSYAPRATNTLLNLGNKTEPDTSRLAELDDELELFTTKRTRLTDRSQVTQWHNEGRLAIKRNGKIVRNRNEIDLILSNKFEALMDSKVVIDNEEYSRIVENCL